jgi:hypothetical protein
MGLPGPGESARQFQVVLRKLQRLPMASLRPTAPPHAPADSVRGQQCEPRSGQNRGRCSDTMTCGPTGRSSRASGSARDTVRGYRRVRVSAATPSSWTNRPTPADPAWRECAYRARGSVFRCGIAIAGFAQSGHPMGGQYASAISTRCRACSQRFGRSRVMRCRMPRGARCVAVSHADLTFSGPAKSFKLLQFLDGRSIGAARGIVFPLRVTTRALVIVGSSPSRRRQRRPRHRYSDRFDQSIVALQIRSSITR